jgi:hypothetical protein
MEQPQPPAKLALAPRRGSTMEVKSMNIMTVLTVAEEKAASKWLADAAESASSESEQAIQAKNALRIITVQNDIIKCQDDIITALKVVATHAAA